MNKKQYNNVIDWTVNHEQSAQTEDGLGTARAIFNNMGVALPNGDVKEVYETIKTDNYMGWKSCTMQEAQQAADNGVAAIGISEDRIVVLCANDEEEPVTKTASVMTLSENTSAYAVDGLAYYSYRCATTCEDGCGNNNAVLLDDTYYLNNKYCGKYLTCETANSVACQSGLLAGLGSSIKWEILNCRNGYVIRVKSDPTKYLCVPTNMSSDAVELVDVSDSEISERCIWSINVATDGGYFVRNVYNSKYLYAVGSIINAGVDAVGTATFDSRVWRIVSTSVYGNADSYTYQELTSNFHFPEMYIDVGQTLFPTVCTYPNNVLWAAATDFDYSFDPNTHFSMSYAKKFTGVKRGPAVEVTATHKVTGCQKKFNIKVRSNMATFLNNLSKLYDLAYAYENQHQANALETMFKYIRTIKYTSGWWPGVAGEKDETFSQYVLDNDSSLSNYFHCDVRNLNKADYIITIPDLTTGVGIDILHMAATLNRYFYSGTTVYGGIAVDAILGKEVDDLCGWAGDFQALIRDYFDAGNDHRTQNDVYNAFYPMIGSDEYYCSISDIISDIDSCNLYTLLSNNTIATGENLKEVFENYYYGTSSNVAAKRFTKWIGSMNDDKLKAKITKYCNDHSLVFVKWPLLKNYSIYDYQQNAFTEAFADYLLAQKALE